MQKIVKYTLIMLLFGCFLTPAFAKIDVCVDFGTSAQNGDGADEVGENVPF